MISFQAYGCWSLQDLFLNLILFLLLCSQVPGQPFDKDLAVRVSNWTQLEADWTLRVHPYLAQRGATSFGSIGTCWGNYVTVKLSTLPEFAAGVRHGGLPHSYTYLVCSFFCQCSGSGIVPNFH